MAATTAKDSCYQAIPLTVAGLVALSLQPIDALTLIFEAGKRILQGIYNRSQNILRLCQIVAPFA